MRAKSHVETIFFFLYVGIYLFFFFAYIFLFHSQSRKEHRRRKDHYIFFPCSYAKMSKVGEMEFQ